MSEGAGKGPGAALRSARESLGISPEDVAGVLNLPVGIVCSIEENAFDTLPAATFTGGYIRSYARLVRLDGNALIREYREATRDAAESELVVEVARPSLTELPQRHPGWVFGGAVFGVALAGAAVLWWAWPQEVEEAPVAEALVAGDARRAPPGAPRGVGRSPGEVPAPATDVAAEAGALEDAAGETGTSVERPAAEGLAPVEGGGREVAPVEGAGREVAPVEGAGREVVAVEGAGEELGSFGGDVPSRAAAPEDDAPAEPTPLETPAPPTVLGSGGDVLELTFDQDCWVEVFDREGRVVHMDMSLGGQSLRLRGEAPFSVRLGNASAAVMAFNGVPVDLGPHTQANVANLVLGN